MRHPAHLAAILGITTTLASSMASAGDVVIFDRGGGVERVQAIGQAVVSAGHTVIGADDTAALDVAYAAGCSDGPCLARAGVAGSVDVVILSEAATVAAIDVVTGVLRRRSATADRIGVVTLKLLEPGRWGTLQFPPLPADAVITVDGAPWIDEDLSPGRHAVVVATAGGDRQVEVDVGAGVVTPVVLPPLSMEGPGPGVVVGLVGLGVGVAGLATGLVGEAMFSSVPLDPVPDAGAARTLVLGEQVATVGWSILVGGAAVAIVGLGLTFAEP